MNKGFLGFLGISGASPLLMGAAGVDLPANAPGWLPWLLALLGPALVFLSKAALKALAAGLRAKAKALKSDKDESNDAQAPVLESVADSLDKAADKKGE